MTVKELKAALSHPIYNDEDEVEIVKYGGSIKSLKVTKIAKRPYVIDNGQVIFYRNRKGAVLLFTEEI